MLELVARELYLMEKVDIWYISYGYGGLISELSTFVVVVLFLFIYFFSVGEIFCLVLLSRL